VSVNVDDARDLAIDHEAEPDSEVERCGIGLALLIVEGFCHAGNLNGRTRTRRRCSDAVS
jgi:hypothetical protein